MKNRRLAIIAFVLVAVMAIGVGYAELTDVLTNKTTVSATENLVQFDSNIQFTGATVTDKKVTPAGTDGDLVVAYEGTGTDVKDTINITVPPAYFTTKDDFVTVTVTGKNNNDVIAYVKSANVAVTGDIAQDDSNYLKVTTNATSLTQLNANSEFSFTVTITLIKTPTEAIDGSVTITLNVSGTDTP